MIPQYLCLKSLAAVCGFECLCVCMLEKLWVPKSITNFLGLSWASESGHGFSWGVSSFLKDNIAQMLFSKSASYKFCFVNWVWMPKPYTKLFTCLVRLWVQPLRGCTFTFSLGTENWHYLVEEAVWCQSCVLHFDLACLAIHIIGNSISKDPDSWNLIRHYHRLLDHG